MPEFHQAGGVPRLLKELEAHLDHHRADRLWRHHRRPHRRRQSTSPARPSSTRPRRPLKPIGTLAVLHGNLAPRGAIIKQSAATDALMQHKGRAVVFDSRRGHGEPHRQRHARRRGRRRPRASQCRPQGRPRHARGGLPADPAQARAAGRQGHGPHLRRADERHRLRHHRPPRHARSRRWRSAGDREDRRHRSSSTSPPGGSNS